MQYLIVLSFIIVYSVFDKSLGFSTTSPLNTHLTYMFQHASLMHLVLNSISFVILFKVLTIYVNKHKMFLSVLAIGFVASFFSEHLLPTVGASSMIYAMVGMLYGLVCRKKLEFEDKKYIYLNLVTLLIYLTMSYLIKNSNFSIHFISLVMGFIVGVGLPKYLKNN